MEHLLTFIEKFQSAIWILALNHVEKFIKTSLKSFFLKKIFDTFLNFLKLSQESSEENLKLL